MFWYPTKTWVRGRGIVLALPLVAMVLGAGSTALAQSEMRIGVFDPLRVSGETREGQRVAGVLKALFERKQGELTALQQALADLQKQRQTQALSLSQEKREQLEGEIQRKALELESARETATRELQLEQSEAERRFQTQLLRVVDAFGRREGFTLILDRNQTVWASQGIDVTTGIVDLFNQMITPAEEQDSEQG